MDHVTQISTAADGKYLALCTCGWRDDQWQLWRHFAIEACDFHERAARELRLNAGPRPSTATLIKQFKANSQNTTYERTEREMWAMLASELERAQRNNQDVEGQLALPLD